MKKPFYKTWWFAAIMSIVVLFGLGVIGSVFGDDKAKEELREENNEEVEGEIEEEAKSQEDIELEEDGLEGQENQENSGENSGENSQENQDQDEGESEGEVLEKDEIKGEIIGKSNKDVEAISDFNPSNINSEILGMGKVLTISESIPIEEYALSYSEEYMGENEIHYIINTKDNTTTSIKKLDQVIYVDIMEYVEKEEEDASILGSGLKLSGYKIYSDGDMEKTD